MNRDRAVAALRELIAALEEPDPPRKPRPRVTDPPTTVDEVARARARSVLKRKGLMR